MTVVISGDTGIDTVQDGAIATADLANAAVTASKLSGAQTGTAPVYGIRAWARWVGSTAGTNAPTAGGNVSTITRNGTGDYTVTLTTALDDANYAISWGARGTNADYDSYTFMIRGDTAPTTTTFRFTVYSQRAGALTDPASVFVQVVR